MDRKIFLDTGVITLFFAKDFPPAIARLKTQLAAGEVNGFTISPLLVEVFFQLCKLRGKDFARTCLRRVEDELLITRIEISRIIEGQAGELKCVYRTKLSYNDCIAIVCALQENIPLYTTEKAFPTIEKLRIQKFEF